MKIVYVLTSNGDDSHVRQTLVSALSLRKYNKNADIIILTDSDTFKTLIKLKSQLLKLSFDVRSCQTPDGSFPFKNRWIKTQLSYYIQPPFLYLDSDTLVLDSLVGLFKTNCGLGLARNHSLRDVKNQIWVGDQEVLDEMGWESPKDIYFNGGVILFNSIKDSQILAQNWHLNWLRTIENSNRFRDQPSLNYTIQRFGIEVADIGDNYNAQVSINVKTIKNAKIIHFYGESESIMWSYRTFIEKLNIDETIVDIVDQFMDKFSLIQNRTFLGKYLYSKLLKNNKVSLKEKRIMETTSKYKMVKLLFGFS
jgi:lipopolysaccharide biosynthesis glycosyltransferase